MQQPARYRHPPLAADWIDRPHRFLRRDRLALESGEAIEDFTLSWVMHGEPDAARGNVVLCLSAIGSTHHRLDFLIGPGRALDPARHCIVCVDAIGNGLTTSPSTSEAQPGTAFPRFTIRDMVESQRWLVQEHLGVRRLTAVIGASMGGMQALQWAVSHPDAMARVVAMTPMAKTHPWAMTVNEAARAALMADPRWAEADHDTAGWKAWVPLMQLLAGRTPASLATEFAGAGDTLAHLHERAAGHVAQGGRAIDWVWQSHAYDAHDVGATPGFAGDTARALASIRAPVLVAAPPLDLYNPEACAREAAAGIVGSRFVEIPSNRGHQAASAALAVDAALLNRAIGDFLDAAGAQP